MAPAVLRALKKRPELAAGLAVAAALGIAYVVWRQRSGESFARTAGRELGAGAVEALSGVAEGAVDAAAGFTGAVVDKGAAQHAAVLAAVDTVLPEWDIEPVPGRVLWRNAAGQVLQRNVRGLQGEVLSPRDGSIVPTLGRTLTYKAEIQNTGSVEQDVDVQIDVDEQGLEPYRHGVGVLTLAPGTGVVVTGRRFVRSPLGGIPFVPFYLRVYGDGFLLGRSDFRTV